MDNLKRLKQLKYFAEDYCIDIFELFSELEIHKQPAPVRNAWGTGRELSALHAEYNATGEVRMK